MSWHRDHFGYVPAVAYPLPPSAPSKALRISDLLSPSETSSREDSFAVHAKQEFSNCSQIQPRLVYAAPAPNIRPVARNLTSEDWTGFCERYEQQAEQQKSPIEHAARPTSSTARSHTSPGSRAIRSRSSTSSPRRPLTPLYPQPSSAGVSIPALPDYEYKLHIRQQPVAARACGHGDRDRRVIDPPPILQLTTTNKQDGSPRLDPAGVFALYCSLVDADTGRQSDCSVQSDLDSRMMSALMGSSTISPFKGKDEHGIAGSFFVFSDLSCRLTGRFRLEFTLLRVDATHMQPGARHPMVASISSDVFTAYNAKEFPGMQASTPLLKALRRQGLTVSIKKGSEQRKLRTRLCAASSPRSEAETSSMHGKRKASIDSVLQVSSRDIPGHKRFRHDADTFGREVV